MKALDARLLVGSAALAACAGASRSVEAVRPEPGVDAEHARGAARSALDVEHFRLDLRIDPEARRLEGACRVRFAAREALRVLELDLAGLAVERVTSSTGEELSFLQEPGRLSIILASPLAANVPAEVLVEYGGEPKKGLHLTGEGRAGAAFTCGPSGEARWWFPCHDVPSDLATFELSITVPEDWTTVAPGELVDRASGGGRRTDTWRCHQPCAPHLVSLAAGPFREVDGSLPGLPIRYLAPAGLGGELPGALAVTPRAIAFLAGLTGRPFPYSKHTTACVVHPPVEGMAAPSLSMLAASVLGGPLAQADEPVSDLVVHEVAHQWFGSLVASGSPRDAWLNEGLATYATDLFFEEHVGVDAFRERIGARRRAPREPDDLFSTARPDEGCATSLHLLRFALGEEAFRAGLRRTVGEGAGRAVAAADLRAAFEAASGKDLTAFFGQWFESPGRPELEVGWEWDASRARLLLRVHQVHALEGGAPQAYQAPIEVEVRVAGSVARHRIELSARRGLFEIPCAAEPEWVRVDPHHWWPAEVHGRRTSAEWHLVLREADDLNDRAAAARALGELARSGAGSEDAALAIAGLCAGLAADPARSVRVAAARALGKLREGRADLLRAAREDAEPAVRVAALDALGNWSGDAELSGLGLELAASGGSYGVRAAAARLAARVDPAGAVGPLRALLAESASAPPPLDPTGEPWRGLIRALSLCRSGPFAIALLDDPSLPEPARIEALRAVLATDPEPDRIRPVLSRLMRGEALQLRRAAIEALAVLGDPDSLALLEALPSDELSPRERRAGR